MIKEISLYLMALLYMVAGINHFMNPRFYLKIIPPQLPFPDAINKLSGLCEIVFGILLLPIATRNVAAWLIILLLIAVFPANIYMAVKMWRKRSPNLWIAIVRLPLQAVLVWWAYLMTQ